MGQRARRSDDVFLPATQAQVGSALFRHFGKKLAPWLIVTAVYLVVATVVVRFGMARNGERTLDFGAELYGMYTQLFFEPTQELPRSALARAVFWITPFLGAGLLLRGLFRVGASVFDADERKRLLVKIMTDRMKDHIVVCGLGHVGVRVVESLTKLGAPVVAIEQRAAESFAEAVEALGVPVLYGDARRDELLVQAGIRRAKAVVCATDHDLTNLEVAIDAKRENPTIRVVMRMFDQRVAGKIGDALDLDETFSTSALAGPLVALQAIESGVRGAYRLADGSLRADVELTAPTRLWGKSVADAEDLLDARIIGMRRGNAPFRRARHDTILAEGDRLTLDVDAEHLRRVTAEAPLG